MRRFVHKDIDHSRDTSFVSADMAEMNQLFPLSLGSLSQSMHMEPNSGSQSLSSSDHEMGFMPYSPTHHGTQSLSPTVMTPTATSLSHDQILSILLENASLSEGAARDLGVPIPSSSERKKNPACSFERIFGQAIAAKTASEDFRSALVSRLVDRNYGLNMHRLYCPNEHCDCVLLNRNSSEWTIRETGPLTDSVPVSESDHEAFNSGAVPQSNAPWLNSLFQSTSTSIDSIGPLRGFWHHAHGWFGRIGVHTPGVLDLHAGWYTQMPLNLASYGRMV
ncbi:hypothetical protein MNAN1_003430 [Malassezia nana]|uniref:Uncharacterized protein n=1 Tax=Malassezia nana TaxID=180528 RepID=A0AAF0J3Z1_9BASI|nr:hypothetical protein MNAN1_003430 [Malassezia nana]